MQGGCLPTRQWCCSNAYEKTIRGCAFHDSVQMLDYLHTCFSIQFICRSPGFELTMCQYNCGGRSTGGGGAGGLAHQAPRQSFAWCCWNFVSYSTWKGHSQTFFRGSQFSGTRHCFSYVEQLMVYDSEDCYVYTNVSEGYCPTPRSAPHQDQMVSRRVSNGTSYWRASAAPQTIRASQFN